MAQSDVDVMSQQDVNILMDDINNPQPVDDNPNDRTVTEHLS